MDIISTLPRDITEKILCHLPIRDALRTSILSSKWRYCWASIPQLKFDIKMFEGSSNSKQIIKHKIANSMLQVLLLHMGPLVKFYMNIELEIVLEIDQIILCLSRRNTLKHFCIVNHLPNHYNLPSSFFSLQKLKNIELFKCGFEPPLTFNGFSTLRRLKLLNVKISPEVLKRVLTNCPILERLYLVATSKHITIGNKPTFVELIDCLPSLVVLIISKFYMEYFDIGGMPQKLQIQLVHLRILHLCVCFMEHDEKSLILCLMKSSPYLTKLYLTLVDKPTSMDPLDLQDFSDLKCDHLEELYMLNFNNLANEMAFAKLVMAKSPELNQLRIQLNPNISVDEELRIFRDLVRLQIPRASSSAELIIERQELPPNRASILMHVSLSNCLKD